MCTLPCVQDLEREIRGHVRFSELKSQAVVSHHEAISNEIFFL